MQSGMWGYSATAGHRTGMDLAGFHVEATDGRIGKVDKHSDEAGMSFLVVDTGPWIFGRRVVLPAGTVVRVDPAEETVHLNRSKDEIKGSPELETHQHPDERTYYEQVGNYYGLL
ncbi:PRC-barrel domain containing protein [Streptacidiphilus sp. 4-A2]|nr:PRC-barrel domain containing protein [Streptacidiphilus sp. 4-A2]